MTQTGEETATEVPRTGKVGDEVEVKGGATCFYCGKLGHFQKNCHNFQKDKGGAGGAEPKKILERRGMSAIPPSNIRPEVLLIIQIWRSQFCKDGK